MNKPIRAFLFAVMTLSMMGMSSTPSEPEQAGAQHAKDHSHYKTVKTHANIDVQYLPTKTFEVGTEETLDFVAINGQPADDVKVWFNAGSGLQVKDADSEISFGPAAAATEHRFQVTLTPTTNGLHYLNVYAAMRIDGQYQARSFAIPVSVGEYDASQQNKPMGVVNEDADGKRVITLPAQESTR